MTTEPALYENPNLGIFDLDADTWELSLEMPDGSWERVTTVKRVESYDVAGLIAPPAFHRISDARTYLEERPHLTRLLHQKQKAT